MCVVHCSPRMPANIRRALQPSVSFSASLARSVSAIAFAAITVLAGAGVPSVGLAQGCAPVASDLLAPPQPGAAMIRPRECSTVHQSPPDFGWPALANTPYTVTLTFPDGHDESRTTRQNWLNWNGILPEGDFEWTVTAGGVSSKPRRFTVAADARPFVVPQSAALIAELGRHAHPRGLPDATTLAAMASERASPVDAVTWLVDSHLDQTLPSAGAQGDGWGYDRYGMRALRALMAYVYAPSDTYRQEAKRRVLNLASWDPRGATAIDDLESAYVAWVVTLGYDWLQPSWSQGDKDAILTMLDTRIGDLYAMLVGTAGWPYGATAVPPPLWVVPRDAHRVVVAQLVATMSTLLVGDLPQAAAWLADLLPYTANMLSPWSGAEGGYANGTAYAMWDNAVTISAWYVLRWATCGSQTLCIDLAQKDWVRNFGRFLAYFSPPTFAPDLATFNVRAADPGTPIGLFGDGFEQAQLFELRARLAKGYAHFAPSPLACWYASSLVGEDYTRIEYLMSPPDTCPSRSVLPPGTPNALYLPATGWVAMHSDLADPGRTSIYFKSSPAPFGAYNHQSADQNAFVINAGGERLAIESGYYDGYNTDHWQYWLKRTRSKNAITFDGGQGQIAYEHQPTPYRPENIRYGAIRQLDFGSAYDIVTGDATDAYNGALTAAMRSLVYLRAYDAVVVYEKLSSGVARQWEWNIHALDPMTVISPDSRVQITRGSQSLCIDALAGPGGSFSQTDQWPAGAEPLSGNPQWHGRFISAQPSAAVEFIAILRVGCAPIAASAVKSGGVWTVTVGERTITIAADGTVGVS